jgi:predicted ATP-dependent Lon-type protease
MAISAAPTAPSPLDQKILEHFPGLVVRKDLTTELKQNAVVPTSCWSTCSASTAPPTTPP